MSLFLWLTCTYISVACCDHYVSYRASCEVDGGFGFDDEEGVGVGAAGVAKFLAGFVEGVGEDGEDDFALGAAYEIEAALLLDELD